MKNVALMVLRKLRIRKARKALSIKALVLKLKTVREAKKYGSFQIVNDVANGNFKYGAMELMEFVRIS